ncbi:Protein of unknown function [Methylomagnum ishizawai]|uniref:DUF1631 domain-containing protein n=2 Tax=Methylomagnum ishizawai TaxID=1760988 RepID=A0A1Y6D235_9GAMM|nr:Protein of unknown function [Methylomagnum ishizawai]
MDSYKTHSSATEAAYPGMLPRYLDLLRTCRDRVVEGFGGLFESMFDELDDFMLQLAENAETNQQRGHYFEAMHTALLNQAGLKQIFTGEIAKGFDNFAAGQAEPLRTPVAQQQRKLSLIDQDDYEVSLAYAEVTRKANEAYMGQLLALNHRLAVLAGGVKLGETHPGLPGCPAQICDAMQTALEALSPEVEFDLLIQWAGEFERRIMQQADGLYQAYNRELILGGILPHLSLEAIGFEAATTGSSLLKPTPPEPVEPPASAPPEDEEPEATPEHELFQGIQDLLANRRREPLPAIVPPDDESALPGHAPTESPGPMAARPARTATSPAMHTDYASLMRSLNALQFNAPSLAQVSFAQMPLDAVKENFAQQSAALATLVQEQQVSSADADIIDLVGMLFEFILNDKSLPDSAKALLSHLHTPYLKVAMLDRKFFFRNKHPARRLLNALSQAGALCNGEGDVQGIFAKMRGVVERVVQDFEDDTRLFNTLLEDFTAFVDQFGHRSEAMEKRSVEAAKGRERLREARQAVSRALVDMTWDHPLPKTIDTLVMGSWANLLVLVYLRNGPDSQQWRDGIQVVTDIIWSVQPKTSPAERYKLWDMLPGLKSRIQDGLALIGDPEVNTKAVMNDIDAVFDDLLSAKEEEETRNLLEPPPGPLPDIRLDITPAPPEIQSDRAVWDDIDPPLPPTEPPSKYLPPEVVRYAEILKVVKLGTWFEFGVPETKARIRAKLSWFSPHTSYYIFVDQGGIQVAVKSMRTLCHEMARGETRIVPIAKKPLMDRALETVHSLLGQSDKQPA